MQDKDMVSALLGMKVQLDRVLNQAFQKNEQFSNALKEAFEKFINQRQNKYANLTVHQHVLHVHQHVLHVLECLATRPLTILLPTPISQAPGEPSSTHLAKPVAIPLSHPTT